MPSLVRRHGLLQMLPAVRFVFPTKLLPPKKPRGKNDESTHNHLHAPGAEWLPKWLELRHSEARHSRHPLLALNTHLICCCQRCADTRGTAAGVLDHRSPRTRTTWNSPSTSRATCFADSSKHQRPSRTPHQSRHDLARHAALQIAS